MGKASSSPCSDPIIGRAGDDGGRRAPAAATADDDGESRTTVVRLTLVDLSSDVIPPAAASAGGEGPGPRRRRTPPEEQEDFAGVVRRALSPSFPPSARGETAAFQGGGSRVEGGTDSGCRRCRELFRGGGVDVDADNDGGYRRRRAPDVVTERSILRFVRLHDRQCMLASALLKSRAYLEDSLRTPEVDDEEAADESDDGIEDCVGGGGDDNGDGGGKGGPRDGGGGEDGSEGVRSSHRAVADEWPRCEMCRNGPLPVVELPRSEYGKPHLPPPTTLIAPPPAPAAAPAPNGDVVHDLSVSHQYPHVGLARLAWRRARGRRPRRGGGGCGDGDGGARDGGAARAAEAGSSLRLDPGGLHVGLDIVVVDEERLPTPESIREHLACFEGSMVPSEWREIVAMGEMWLRLKEFHVRWAMKEAYTKALGFGLGLDFDSFEIFPCEVGGGGSSSFSWYLDLVSAASASASDGGPRQDGEGGAPEGGGRDRAAANTASPEGGGGVEASPEAEAGIAPAAGTAAVVVAMIPRLARIRHVRDNVRWSGASSSSSGTGAAAGGRRGGEETWQFWFGFLDGFDAEGGGEDGPAAGAMSVACLCVGPVDADGPRWASGAPAVATVEVRRTSMEGLLRWHRRGNCLCGGGDD